MTGVFGTELCSATLAATAQHDRGPQLRCVDSAGVIVGQRTAQGQSRHDEPGTAYACCDSGTKRWVLSSPRSSTGGSYRSVSAPSDPGVAAGSGSEGRLMQVVQLFVWKDPLLAQRCWSPLTIPHLRFPPLADQYDSDACRALVLACIHRLIISACRIIRSGMPFCFGDEPLIYATLVAIIICWVQRGF